MDKIEKFRGAYKEWMASRKAFEAWMRPILLGNEITDQAEGLRLANQVQASLQKFMEAAKPISGSR
jgi:hypothetical protein